MYILSLMLHDIALYFGSDQLKDFMLELRVFSLGINFIFIKSRVSINFF